MASIALSLISTVAGQVPAKIAQKIRQKKEGKREKKAFETERKEGLIVESGKKRGNWCDPDSKIVGEEIVL